MEKNKSVKENNTYNYQFMTHKQYGESKEGESKARRALPLDVCPGTSSVLNASHVCHGIHCFLVLFVFHTVGQAPCGNSWDSQGQVSLAVF